MERELTCYCMVIIAFFASQSDAAARFTTLYRNRVDGNRTGSATIKFSYDVDSSSSSSGLFIECGYSNTNGFQTYVKKSNDGAVTSTNSRASAWTETDNKNTIGFTISNLQSEDMRNYYCSMVPPGGGSIEKSQLVYLDVLDRPRFTSCITGQPNSIKAEDQLLFTCLVVGNPRPSLRCDLYGSNGKNLETINPVGNITNQGFSNLPIESHMIKCVASHERTGKTETGLYFNECGNDPSCNAEYPTIEFTHKPYQVKEFQLVEHTEGSLRYKWLPVRANETGGALDFHYLISYYLTNLGVANTTNVRVEQTTLQNPALDPFQYHTLNGLMQKQSYTVKIVAVNQLGKSVETIAPPTITNPAARKGGSGSSDLGAILGGVFGGIVLIVVIVVLVIYCSRKKDQNQKYPTSYVEDAVEYPNNGGLYSDVKKAGSKNPSLAPSRAGGGSQTSGYPDVINSSDRLMADDTTPSFELSDKTFI